MKRFFLEKFFLGMFFVGVTLLLTGVGAEAGAWEREKREGLKEITYVPGEILVKWKDWVDEPSIGLMHQRRGARVASTFYATHRRERTVQQVRLREGQTVEEALREYRRDPLVKHAQPNYLYRLQTIPDDTHFNKLWGLHNTGQTGGTSGADIDAPEAWGLTIGSADVIIAVIDTGVNYNHPELAGNMWRNPGEISGDGIDNDRNGLIDDIYGWDFFDGDNDPMDFHGHGTHVAGTIAAQGNNTAGITGVMRDAQIMALKATGVAGFFPVTATVPAIEYAVRMGAHIINASWGGGGGTDAPGDILRDAIEAAGTAGVLFVAAAGNGGPDRVGDNNDTTPMFPASYTLDNIISVAATDHNDSLASFSNFGAASVDVAAPGVSILSTIPTFSYGTSVTLYGSAGFDAYPLGASPPPNWVNIANQAGISNTWAVTNTHSLSAFHSFADSPLASYTDNLISTETLTYLNMPITHIPDSRYRFTFDIRYDLGDFDFLDVVASTDALTWEFLPDWFITGSSGGAFASHDLNITKLIERYRTTRVFLGFGIDSDAITTGEGVYIDNLSLTRRPILIAAHDYRFDDGTSFAAPHVAGLAGLLLSRAPTLTVAQLKALILENVDVLGLPIRYGGRINAHSSLLALPTVTITSTAPADPTNVLPIPMTATFSENVSGFELGDITVGNGTAGNFVRVSAEVYIFSVTPIADGVVTVDIAAAVATDIDTNPNIAAPQFSITHDGTPPAVTIDAVTTPTNVATQTLTGTGEAGLTVVLTADTTATFTQVTYPTATTWTSDVTLIEGSNVIIATSTDAAGNIGTDTATIFLEIPVLVVIPAANGCFIATAAYGTPLAQEVEVLKMLRDEHLLTNPLGRTLVSAYERISPPLAELIRRNPTLKKGVRVILRPLIWVSRKVIE